MTSDQHDPTEGHSPLPWTFCESGMDWLRDAGDHGIVMFDSGFAADAALIVREVNEAPKLREENAKLRELLDTDLSNWLHVKEQRDELRAEVERLREALEGALVDIDAAWDSIGANRLVKAKFELNGAGARMRTALGEQEVTDGD